MSLTLKIYSSGTTELPDPGNEFSRASGIRFATQYPGGLFSTFSAFFQRKVVKSWQVAGAQRLCIYNGISLIWEGKIANMGRQLTETDQGILVTAQGYWAEVLMQRRVRKPWADTQIGEDAWPWLETASAADKCDLNRDNQIKFVPKAEAWTTDQIAVVTYTAPTGQTVKRVTFSADLQEGGEAWQMELVTTGGTTLWSRNSSGTEAVDHTLGTPVQAVRLQFRAKADQTPTADGTYYAKFSSVVIYTETGDIHSSEIVKDVAALDSRISADLSLITANTLDLVPFTTDELGGHATYADIANGVAKYGDASFNNWAVGIRGSDQASDAKPILFFEVYPALTDYDYAVRIDEPNLMGSLDISQDFDELYNSIIVQYQSIKGKTIYIAPDDDANLKDTTSIADYGQRDALIQVNTSDTTTATKFGRTYLAAHKDPTWRVNGNISMVGYVRSKGGQNIPACEIVAGKRIRIENYLDDLSGTGLTFLISTTEYEASSDSVSLGVGNVDRLDVFLAALERYSG